MPFPQDPIRIEFVLSFEDWLEAREYKPKNEKERKALYADYLLFSAERRSFEADGHGWIYTFSAGKAEHSWTDMIVLYTRQRTITLMTMGGQYVLPQSALEKSELERLKAWLEAVMNDTFTLDPPTDTDTIH
jgi:hypothetical protein